MVFRVAVVVAAAVQQKQLLVAVALLAFFLISLLASLEETRVRVDSIEKCPIPLSIAARVRL